MFSGAVHDNEMVPSPVPVAVKLRGELAVTPGVMETDANAPVVEAVSAATRNKRDTPLVTPSTTYVNAAEPVLGVIDDHVLPPFELVSMR
ncbi:unannotated protein [freshwater metagenome]|uniref:Unannotated protein n=1 Tax=freshwater metagenome TaxID=449393 RepID=A0A6J6M0X5_9ZZZZ